MHRFQSVTLTDFAIILARGVFRLLFRWTYRSLLVRSLVIWHTVSKHHNSDLWFHLRNYRAVLRQHLQAIIGLLVLAVFRPDTFVKNNRVSAWALRSSSVIDRDRSSSCPDCQFSGAIGSFWNATWTRQVTFNITHSWLLISVMISEPSFTSRSYRTLFRNKRRRVERPFAASASNLIELCQRPFRRKGNFVPP